MFSERKRKEDNSDVNDSKHSRHLIISKFLHECNFDAVLPFQII